MRSREARENRQLRMALVDSVRHELCTPLTSIKASVTMLLTNSELQPSQRNELLIVIDEEADRLNRLVDEAMEAARLDGSVKLDLKPHAIEELVDAARESCRTLLGQRPVSVQLEPGLPAVRADLNRAEKALVQLLENAAKYSPAGEPAEYLPVRTIGQPEDIANAVLFLMTTTYATGSTVRVDGGGVIA